MQDLREWNVYLYEKPGIDRIPTSSILVMIGEVGGVRIGSEAMSLRKHVCGPYQSKRQYY
jgi:hypothetical protein